jgi:hypothetical protein
LPGFVDSLANALAAGILAAFDPLPAPEARIPTRPEFAGQDFPSSSRLSVVKFHRGSLGLNAVLLHPQEMQRLGLLDGDRLSLHVRGETMDLAARASVNVAVGRIAISSRIRSQLDLAPRQQVDVRRACSTGPALVRYPADNFVLGLTRPGKTPRAWASPASLNTLQLDQPCAFLCAGPFRDVAAVAVQLTPEAGLPEGAITATEPLVEKLVLTLGDTIMIRTRI